MNDKEQNIQKIYILLPVHNRREVTRQCIASLQKQTFKHFHLVLLDDGSTDGTEEMVKSLIASVSVIKGKGDWWWAGALQEGYLWLQNNSVHGSDAVLILNDDNTFEPTFLHRGISLLEQRNRILLASKIYGRRSGKLIDGAIFADWMRWKFVLQEDSGNFNCLSTRALFMRVSDFREIGGFYPGILPHYCSDYEFTIRAMKKGFNLFVHDELRTTVDEEATGLNSVLNQKSYVGAVRKLFSKKYMMNPLYMTSFIMLACPWQWKPLNLARVWGSTFWKIFRYTFIFAYRAAKK